MAKPLFSRHLGNKQEKGVNVSVSSSKTYLRKFSPFSTLKTIPSSNAMGRNAAFNNELLGDPYPNHSTCFTDTKKPENINERDRKQKLGKTTSLRGRKMFLSRIGVVTVHTTIVLMPMGQYLKSLHDEASCELYFNKSEKD